MKWRSASGVICDAKLFKLKKNLLHNYKICGVVGNLVLGD